MTSLYSNDFHKGRHQKTHYSATKIISLIINHFPRIESCIDIGCGLGTWLDTFHKFGVSEIKGVDGPWVNLNDLVIPSESFVVNDLNSPLNISKKFDLAMSLEVAEHLLPSQAINFIRTLTNLSDFVIFSAAHPYQGGVGHINEQWPSYWIALFEQQGFIALDIVRRHIWDDEKIPTCYRKNILIYVKKERISELKLVCDIDFYTPPEKYILYFTNLTKPGIKQSIDSLMKAIYNRIK